MPLPVRLYCLFLTAVVVVAVVAVALLVLVIDSALILSAVSAVSSSNLLLSSPVSSSAPSSVLSSAHGDEEPSVSGVVDDKGALFSFAANAAHACPRYDSRPSSPPFLKLWISPWR